MQKRTSRKFNRFSIKNPSMVFFVLFLVIVCVVYWSTALFSNVRGINLRKFAKNRNTYSTILTAKRGTIYDNGENTLALNVSSYTVIAYLDSSRTTDMKNPMHVVDKEGTASKLAPLINMSEEYILKLLNTKGAYQVELGPGGRGITTLLKEQIEELNLPGIDFVESYKRYYPNGNFASYIVGYAKTNEKYDEDGTINKSIDGELGLEALYNDKLKGTDGSLSYEQDGNGYKIPGTKESKVDAQNGYDIYLTIDSTIQRFVEDALEESYNTYNPEWILFYVMDAKTGDILAGSSYPSFDPNKLNLTNYENPLVSYEYEPGSVMKTYTYMCAIDKGTYKGDEKYQSGSIEVGTQKIYDWNTVGFGLTTFDLGYEFSSNVAITNIVQKFINKEDLHDCFTKYGFGAKTNIDLPRELDGTLTFNYPIEVAAAGYGQGITTTPIQHLRALSIIANNGKMLTPHIISKIVNPNTNEIVFERKVEESNQLVKKSTITKMKDLMWNVVNGDHGSFTTGAPYKIDGFDVMGKTGTAEIFNNATGRYEKNEYIYSFSGIYPKDDPEIIIFASVKKPNGYKSKAIYTAFKEVAQNIAKYKNMFTESVVNDLKEIKLDSYINQNITVTKNMLESKKLDVVVIGNGNTIIKQYPSTNTKLLENDKVYLITNSLEYTMPNLKGFSKVDVNRYFNLIGLKVKIEGTGYVTSQNIKAGTVISKDDDILITLSDKYLENE